MNVPDIGWIVQREKYVPGPGAVKLCVTVHGPRQVSPWPKPGTLNERLCSIPSSALRKVAVTVWPARTRSTCRSNSKSLAPTLTAAGPPDGAGGEGVGGATVARVASGGAGVGARLGTGVGLRASAVGEGSAESTASVGVGVSEGSRLARTSVGVGAGGTVATTALVG